MIVFRQNGEIVRIECWEDMIDREAFTYDLKSTDIQLKDVIGSYKLPTSYYCGLADCHQPHKVGYLVLTEDDRETNVGHNCGSTHFGLEFRTLTRQLDRDLEAFENRENLTSEKIRSPGYREKINKILENYDVEKIYDLLRLLTTKRSRFPEKIPDTINRMLKQRSGNIVVEEKLSSREMELSSIGASNFAEAKGHSKGKGQTSYTTKVIGFVKGIDALHPSNNALKIIKNQLIPLLDELDTFDIDSSSDADVQGLLRRFKLFDKRIDESKKHLYSAIELLDCDNLMQLYPLVANDRGSDVFKDYCKYSVGSKSFYKAA